MKKAPAFPRAFRLQVGRPLYHQHAGEQLQQAQHIIHIEQDVIGCKVC